MRQKRWTGLTIATGGVLVLISLCVALWRCAIPNRRWKYAPRRRAPLIPDGFSVWHHLDANGIRFKSITPQNDTLLIKFDSSAQSEAAKEVLYRSLPQGFIIAQQEEDNLTSSWLSRIRSESRHLG